MPNARTRARFLQQSRGPFIFTTFLEHKCNTFVSNFYNIITENLRKFFEIHPFMGTVEQYRPVPTKKENHK